LSEQSDIEIASVEKSVDGETIYLHTNANPPGYRKHGDDHPRSTITFKAAGFNLDTQYGRVRLSKGSNLKDYWSDFLFCEYQTRPDVDLSPVESVQQVRAVWTGDQWEPHGNLDLHSWAFDRFTDLLTYKAEERVSR